MRIRMSTSLALLGALAVVALMIGAQAQAGKKPTVITIATHQSEITPNVQNTGWWDDAGTHGSGNDNYEVGVAPDLNPEILRNFFTFDTSLAGRQCASAATLEIPIGEGSGDFGGLATVANYLLKDVSTDATTLNTGTGPDTTIYHDLGTGTTYGNRKLPTAGPYGSLVNFTVDLNAAGLAALNAAIKAPHPGYFSLGGMIQGEPANVSLFGFTPVTNPHDTGELPVRLVITAAPC